MQPRYMDVLNVEGVANAMQARQFLLVAILKIWAMCRVSGRACSPGSRAGSASALCARRRLVSAPLFAFEIEAKCMCRTARGGSLGYRDFCGCVDRGLVGAAWTRRDDRLMATGTSVGIIHSRRRRGCATRWRSVGEQTERERIYAVLRDLVGAKILL
jgi:hypothetical protein